MCHTIAALPCASHALRAGLAERCFAALLQRATDATRRPFGRTIAEHATTQEQIAECRCVHGGARAC